MSHSKVGDPLSQVAFLFGVGPQRGMLCVISNFRSPAGYTRSGFSRQGMVRYNGSSLLKPSCVWRVEGSWAGPVPGRNAGQHGAMNEVRRPPGVSSTSRRFRTSGKQSDNADFSVSCGMDFQLLWNLSSECPTRPKALRKLAGQLCENPPLDNSVQTLSEPYRASSSLALRRAAHITKVDRCSPHLSLWFVSSLRRRLRLRSLRAGMRAPCDAGTENAALA